MAGARTVKFGTQIHRQGYWLKKRKIRSKGVGKGSHDPLLKFWDNSISREWLELETSNLASWFITRGTNERNAKLGQRGSGKCHVSTYFWNFGTFHISGTVGARNVKFGVLIHHPGYRPKEIRSNGSGRGRVTYFWNFGTPFITREVLELETSNLSGRLTTRSANESNVKLGQWGREDVTWPTFEILAPLHISGTVRVRNFKFGASKQNANIRDDQ